MTDTNTNGAPAPIPDPRTAERGQELFCVKQASARREFRLVAEDFPRADHGFCIERRDYGLDRWRDTFALVAYESIIAGLIDRVRAAEAEVEKLRAEVNRLKDRSPLLVLSPDGTPSHMLHRTCDAKLEAEAHGPERESGCGRPLAAPPRHLGHLLRFFIERHLPDLRDYVLMSLAAQGDSGLTDADRRKLLAIATDQRAFEELMRATAMLLVEDTQRGIEERASCKAHTSEEVAILRARVAELEAENARFLGIIARGEDMFRRYDDLVRGYTETIDRLTGRKGSTT